MDRQTAIDRLIAHEAEQRAMGVTSLSLFCSVARGEAGLGSDVDVVAVFDDERVRTLFDMVGVNDRLAEMLGTKVDFVSEDGLKPRFRARVDEDRLRAFC